MKKLLWLAIPMVIVFGALGVLVLLVLSGRVSMDVPERIVSAVKEKLKKPLENLQELKYVIIGRYDPNMDKPEYYDLY